MALEALEAWVRARIDPKRLSALASLTNAELGRVALTLVADLERERETNGELAMAALRYVEALPKRKR